MFNALEVVTTVIIGVMVGVEFSVAFVMNPILNALPRTVANSAMPTGAGCSAP
ncbi:hypothetical protein SAV31267_097630 [Streptomyces avermitilis]|uniref:Uncharacterized protein n=1 Tax=Streptomyces avermitilis TaxID=33903 RepID=A0A4D4N6Q8_STRAX|nr:hypothetical protein SAV31267_097630 [Streptomyces avermitilis]